VTRLVATVFGEQTDVRGWLSLPDGANGRLSRGIVVCAPFGHPDICSYRPLRTLAESLAEDGWPVLRFDWPGVGDSADPDTPIASVDDWVSVVRQAVAHVRDAAAVEDVSLVGLRIGATIAALAAADPSVADIALLAPYANGRAYLKELRMFQAAFSAPLSAPPVTPPPVPAGSLEAAGFVVGPDEVSAFEALDLTAVAERSLARRRVLVATAQPNGAINEIVRRIRTVGEVTYVESREVAELSSEAIAAVVPTTLNDVIRNWFGEARVRAHAGRTSVARARTTVALEGCASEDGVIIRTARGRLVGVTCEPADGSGPWVVFLSAGAVRHIGPNRLWTTYARHWADMGIRSLRLDLHGVGDSDGAREHDHVPDDSIARMYEDDVSQDVSDALDWLTRSRGAESFVLVGLCSGAHWALHSAVSDSRVVGVGLVNPVTLEWDPAIPAVVAFDHATRFIHRPRSLRAAFTKGFSSSALLALRGATTRLLLARRMRAAGRRLRLRLETLADWNTDCHFVFGRDEDGLIYLQRTLGAAYASELERLGMTIDIVDGVDHTFKPVWSHDVLRRSLETHLPRLSAPGRSTQSRCERPHDRSPA
jgi:pimeloyl-ACP methyl ester carboxylesterase